MNNKECKINSYQKAKLCIPVSVKPDVKIHDVKTICVGKPEIIHDSQINTNSPHDGICRYAIIQNICVEIPISIDAKSELDCVYVECLGQSVNNDCICNNAPKEN